MRALKRISVKETCQNCKNVFNFKSSLSIDPLNNSPKILICKKCKKKDGIENLLLKDFEKGELKSFINNIGSYIKDL